MAGFNPVFSNVGDDKTDFLGAIPVSIQTLTFAAGDTYLTGGMALLAAQFGMSRPIGGISVIGYNTAGIGIEWFWNTQTQKLQARWTGPAISGVLAEVGNTTPIAGFAITLLVFAAR